MPEGRKIATCCYCGTRSVLVMDRARHELTCAACGAPLHDMKAIPRPAQAKPDTRKRPASAARRRGVPEFPREYPRERPAASGKDWRKRTRKSAPKRRKPFMRRVFEELWDEIEDIFD